MSQFMVRSKSRSLKSRCKYMAARAKPGKRPLKGFPGYLHRNCGLFRSLPGAPHALRQRGHEIGDR
ncbi:MAG TPA: hypothetical protein VGL45_01385, partial [Bradyrhizobium sp.]